MYNIGFHFLLVIFISLSVFHLMVITDIFHFLYLCTLKLRKVRSVFFCMYYYAILFFSALNFWSNVFYVAMGFMLEFILYCPLQACLSLLMHCTHATSSGSKENSTVSQVSELINFRFATFVGTHISYSIIFAA